MRQARLQAGRPAAELVSGGGREWLELTAWASSAPASGELRIGDAVVLSFDDDTARCLRCGTRLGGARDDFRRGCLADITGTSAAGPARGQDYGQEAVQLVRYYCPGCARQLDVSVLYQDQERHRGYLPAARIAAPGRPAPDGCQAPAS